MWKLRHAPRPALALALLLAGGLAFALWNRIDAAPGPPEASVARYEDHGSRVIGTPGFFHLKKDAGVWWFVDPNGQRQVSLGINHVTPIFALAKADLPRSLERYGADLVDAQGRPNFRGAGSEKFMREAIERVQGWNFNTLGMHTAPSSQRALAYVPSFRPAKVDGWIHERPEYPDPFSAGTAAMVDRKARAFAAGLADDRLVLGISFNDMPLWRSQAGQVHPWVDALRRQPAASDGKRRWIERLRARHRDAGRAAQVYGVEAASWDELAARVEWPDAPAQPRAALEDEQAFLPEIADTWYRLLSTSMRRYAPNHLLLGDKIIPPVDLPEWLDPILGEYFDVIFLQWYDQAENQIPRLRDLHQRSGKPILLGDSSFSHPNARVPKPKGVHVASQAEVGPAYAHYLERVMAEPYVVGWHYCGYMEGARDLERFHKFEAIQNGFVRPDGSVYEDTVREVSAANAHARDWHAAARPLLVPRVQTVRGPGYQLTVIDGQIYELRTQAHGSIPNKPIAWVVTDEGVVVYDTGTRVSAEIALRLIRQVTDKPIHTLIYSHHHGTQLMGAPVLRERGTRILAHEDLLLELDRITDLYQYHHRLNRVQFDLPGGPRAEAPYAWTYPTETYRDRTSFRLGGLDFEVSHHEGEAEDYSVLWIPQKRALFVADLLGNSMPMVASPMKPVRDPLKWKRALEEFRALRPDFLFFTSGLYSDREAMDAHLALHIEFLDFLHHAVAEEINRGSTVEEALRRIELPEHMRGDPRLRQEYGSLEFAIRGLYHDYRGWFDMNATHLSPILPRERARALVEAMGGEQPVLARARAAREAGQPALALEFLDLAIDGASSQPARQAKSEILAELARAEQQPLKRNMLHRLSAIELEPLGAGTAAAPGRPHARAEAPLGE